MSHTVTVEELNDYVEQKRGEWQRFATSFSPGTGVKVLEFNAQGLYRVVFDHDRYVYVGALMGTAVHEYNALP